MGAVIVILVVVAFAWLLFGVPQRRRSRAHAAMQDSIEVGDEIITAGGLHAVVRDLGEREVRIEIAPNVVATLDRRAIAAVAEEEPVEDEPDAVILERGSGQSDVRLTRPKPGGEATPAGSESPPEAS